MVGVMERVFGNSVVLEAADEFFVAHRITLMLRSSRSHKLDLRHVLKRLGQAAEQSEIRAVRGRAALQRRVESMESARASAPMVAFSVHREFFRSLSAHSILACYSQVTMPPRCSRPDSPR